MILQRWIVPTALMALSAASMAATMTVNVKEGDSIAGMFKFVVRVQSESVVSNVEFYVNDDLRGTDESTPYEFELDTLEEDEGDLNVMFHAFTSDGASVKKTFKLKVDNGLAKGVKFHVDESNAYSTDSKFNEAVISARRALKIEPTNNDARLAMARANLGLGVFDIAQKFAEDVIASDATNVDAHALMTGISLRRAFMAGGADSLATITGALKVAATSQNTVLQNRADRSGVSKDDLIAWADTQLAANRFSAVATELRPKFDSDVENTDIADRLMYAQVRAGRLEDAARTLDRVEKYGSSSGYTYIMRAIILQMRGRQADSELAEKEAILTDPNAPGVKYGQAFLALNRGRVGVFNSYAESVMNDAPTSSDATYYASIRSHLAKDYDNARRHMETSLLANPANYDMYVERGHQVIESALSQNLTGDSAKQKYQLAKAYFDAALAARPESYEALIGLSLAHNFLGETAQAVSFGDAAVRSAPQFAAARYVYASALRAAGRNPDATAQVAEGGKLDSRLMGRTLPQVVDAWRYTYTSGRSPLLPPPSVVAE